MPGDVLALLLAHGADLKAVDKKGETALIYAATTPNWTAALRLLQGGADWTRGRSLAGLTFAELVQKYLRDKRDGGLPAPQPSSDDSVEAVLKYLQRNQRP